MKKVSRFPFLIVPHRGKVSTESQARNSHRGMACQNLGHHLPHRGMMI